MTKPELARRYQIIRAHCDLVEGCEATYGYYVEPFSVTTQGQAKLLITREPGQNVYLHHSGKIELDGSTTRHEATKIVGELIEQLNNRSTPTPRM